HVDDLADACVFLMENIDAKEMKKLNADYFVNIGAGEDLTVKDLAFLIKDIIGFAGNIQFDHTKPDGTPKKLLDISKIKQLGWQPKIDLKTGINDTYKWYQKHKNIY
ncbi:MAG: GDP-L-fucose synthase, partial [Candidatus Goldbacteria bacterium]|nr:GDP-L-fucose synthase [Candidatus Goldiibacteriota bacterium]